MVCNNYEECGNFANFDCQIEYDEGAFIKTLIFCEACFLSEKAKEGACVS